MATPTDLQPIHFYMLPRNPAVPSYALDPSSPYLCSECPVCGEDITIHGGGDGYDWAGNYGAMPEEAECYACGYEWCEGYATIP